MADPATILTIINGSAGLALTVGAVVNKLYTISQNLKYAELTIQSIASECEIIKTAWVAIESWIRAQPDHSLTEQQPVLDRLGESLVFGTGVLSALEDDLAQFTSVPRSLGFFGRGKVVWSEAAFEKHQNRIRGQVAAMTLLLQIIKLPSPAEMTDLLAKENELLKASDDTAWTIVDSSASFSARHPNSGMSLESLDTISINFDFEPEMWSAPLYARSYKYLARKMGKREDKEPIHNIQASMVIPARGENLGTDEVSIISITRPVQESSPVHDVTLQPPTFSRLDKTSASIEDRLRSSGTRSFISRETKAWEKKSKQWAKKQIDRTDELDSMSRLIVEHIPAYIENKLDSDTESWDSIDLSVSLNAWRKFEQKLEDTEMEGIRTPGEQAAEKGMDSFKDRAIEPGDWKHHNAWIDESAKGLTFERIDQASIAEGPRGEGESFSTLDHDDLDRLDGLSYTGERRMYGWGRNGQGIIALEMETEMETETRLERALLPEGRTFPVSKHPS